MVPLSSPAPKEKVAGPSAGSSVTGEEGIRAPQQHTRMNQRGCAKNTRDSPFSQHCTDNYKIRLFLHIIKINQFQRPPGCLSHQHYPTSSHSPSSQRGSENRCWSFTPDSQKEVVATANVTAPQGQGISKRWSC